MESSLTGATITVYVGPKSKRYSIHTALLTQYEWFRNKIYYPGSTIPIRSSITLVDEDPKVFELLMSWLYRKNLRAISTTDEEVAKGEVALYIDMYLRACAWDIQDLQNALMNRLRVRETCRYGYFPRDLIKKIYQKTEPQSPLRSYIVDSFLFKGIQWNAENAMSATFTLTRKGASQNSTRIWKSRFRDRLLRSLVPALRQV